MQVAKGAKPRNRLELRIPAGAAGNEDPLILAAQVIGSRPTGSPGDTRGVNLSVLFKDLDQRTRQRLAALLSHLEVGPPTLAR